MDLGKLIQTVLFMAAGWWLYNHVKSDFFDKGDKSKNDPADVAFQVGTSAIPAGFNPNELAKEAHSLLSASAALTDINIFDDRNAFYGKLLSLTNDQLILTYNTYKKLYYSHEHKTLTQLIDATWDNLFAHGKTKRQIVVKLRMLNCK